MGMGPIPAHTTIITVENMKSLPLAGPAITKLLDFMEKHDIEPQQLDEHWRDCTDAEVADEVYKEFEGLHADLAEAFLADTGMTVYPFYYSEDEGGRYDDLEVSDVYWSVDGVYERTKEAEKVKDLLTDVSWTVYG